MPQVIKLKKSAVSGKAPAVGDLVLGELAINTFDGKLFLKKDNGTASIVEIGGGGGGTITAPISNRIINGRMEIDQRNNGSAVTVNAQVVTWSLDRWFGVGQATDGVFSLQRQAGGPVGFANFLRLTTTTADASIGASQFYVVGQQVEGNMISDLAWGTASAGSATLRFWARSSLTGAYSGSIRNNTGDRSYAFSFSILSANTWELKAVTIPGETVGTWLADTGIGIRLIFDLGSGSTHRGTAGSWVGTSLFGVTGAVSLISTLNATFDITGVELVKSSADIGPTWRPFPQELDLCRRYGRLLIHEHRANSSAASNFWTAGVPLSPPMRATPTATQTAAGTLSNLTTATCVPAGPEIAQLNATTAAAGDAYITGRTYFLNAEL